MEIAFGEESCELKGQTYSHGSRVCEGEKCIVCMEGNWKDVKDLLSGEIEREG